jgi:hypothetical protein
MRISFAPFLQGLGSLGIAFGLIREVFGNGLPPRVIDPRAPLAATEQYLAQAQEIILHIGGKFMLIPTEHAITAADHRLDAEIAVVGFIFLVIAAVISTVKKVRGR